MESSYNDSFLMTPYAYSDCEYLPLSPTNSFNLSKFPQSEVAAPTLTLTDATIETRVHQPPTVEDLEPISAPKRRRQRKINRNVRVRAEANEVETLATLMPGVAAPPRRDLCKFGCTGRNSVTYHHANTLWRHYLDKHVPEEGHRFHQSSVKCSISGCSFVGRRYRVEKFTNHFRANHRQNFDELKTFMLPNRKIHNQTKDELEKNLIEFLLHNPPPNSPPHDGPFLTHQDIGLEGKRSIMTEDEKVYEKHKKAAKANCETVKREGRPWEIPPRRQAIPTADSWALQHTDCRGSGLIYSPQPNLFDTGVDGNLESDAMPESDVLSGLQTSFGEFDDSTTRIDEFMGTDCPNHHNRSVFNSSQPFKYDQSQTWSPSTSQYALGVPDISGAEFQRLDSYSLDHEIYSPKRTWGGFFGSETLRE